MLIQGNRVVCRDLPEMAILLIAKKHNGDMVTNQNYFKDGIYKEGMDMSALQKIDGISTTYREFYEGLDHDVLICKSSDDYEDEDWYAMDFTHGVKYLGSTDWRFGGMLRRGANPM